MSALRRTEAAGFSLAEAVPLEALLDAPDPAALLRPVDAYFFRYPAMTVEGTALRKAKNGNPFPCSAADGDWRGIPAAGPVRRGDDEHYQELFRGVAVCRQRNV